MQQRNMQMLDNQNNSPRELTSLWPVPLTGLKTEKKSGWLKVCHFVIVVIFFIALAGLAFGMFYLHQLHQEVEQLKQKINGNPQKRPQMLTGAEDNEPNNEVKMAAHLTGKESTDHSNRLMWEISLGHAFTNGITYKNGALIINETGHYFIYAKIYFRGRQCEAVPLQQSVVKRNSNYQYDLSLMEITVINPCNAAGAWGKNTFQAGIFHLSEGVQLFVSVSHPRMVSTDELMTFFGLYKL
ncbi:tumor necrosis factor ligand superfamily member 6-like [Heterodontus francisci]|uniref:tumor necrosis factor ligand superfamily member 6-like n=1 Tax=Heterodontus francisci TaxID=7792 RepID=UPI00355C4441